MNKPLDKALRDNLEVVVKEARIIAEKAAEEALNQLGVSVANAPEYLNDIQRNLRKRLRAHGRQLGDTRYVDGRQEISALIEEIAYEHWHRMLFARFLAENDLLIYNGTSISLEECEQIAKEQGISSQWSFASECATRMLPQIFRLDSPSFELVFAKDKTKKLEKLLLSINEESFHASDSIGWIYQFWQTKQKEIINDSGSKIGGRELPAVTQLFTEPYMVSFLLDNSLGAWYAAQKLAGLKFDSEAEAKSYVSSDIIPLTYLRLIQQEDKTWKPINGCFEKWPKSLKDFSLLDPCCGSGHFLVASFMMLVPMRMELENLDANNAIDAVFRDNIYGLELDQRCVEIAAFAVALAAWNYPGSSGYRPLPDLHIACDGVAPRIKKADWLAISQFYSNNPPERIKEQYGNKSEDYWYNLINEALSALFVTFQNAPILGSLINTKHLTGDLFQADFSDISQLLKDSRDNSNEDIAEVSIAAHGIMKAMDLLQKKYTLTITNVPYLGRGKQCTVLQKYCLDYYPEAKSDLATVFLDRNFDFLEESGFSCTVLPQNWLFQSTYKGIRQKVLKERSVKSIVRLGEHGFESNEAAGAFAILISIAKERPNISDCYYDFDLTEYVNAVEKKNNLLGTLPDSYLQSKQLHNIDCTFVFSKDNVTNNMAKFAHAYQGIKTGDDPKLKHFFWEDYNFTRWHLCEGGISDIFPQGYCYTLDWNKQGKNMARLQGKVAFSQNGFSVTNVRNINVYQHTKSIFTSEITTIIPNHEKYSLAIAAYVQSEEFVNNIRSIDQSLGKATASFTKVPFDLDYWNNAAQTLYPNGFPKPYTNDPTQWIFHGHPCANVVWDETQKKLKIADDRIDETVLHIAIARLLGFRWPAEKDKTMELASEMREVMAKNTELEGYSDNDGIVPLPALCGENTCSTRLLKLLASAYEKSWSSDILDGLLEKCDCNGRMADDPLDYWLRNKFFSQHAKMFGNRPFIWQIWDGLKDGFSVLVNYQTLTRNKLENLIYNYLGNWIQRQQDALSRKIDGAQEKLEAAESLKKKLEEILKGEKPYDIFVRWKPLAEQPIGWNPDFNDGVRVNIRPFVTAGILRSKFTIHWKKESKGKDNENSPWFFLFKGERINDHHLSLEEKRKAHES